MSIYNRVANVLIGEQTRSPFSRKPTVEQAIHVWEKAGRVVCCYPTEECPIKVREEVQSSFCAILKMCISNLLSPGWEPRNFHSICAKLNVIYKGYAQVSVAEEWAFGEREEWNDWRSCFANNLKGSEKL